jgi:uncharacterized protein (DUF433 family)
MTEQRAATQPPAAWRDHIERDPNVLTGKPVIKDTRISVELVLDLFGSGWTEEDILDNYPHLSPADIRACLLYAREQLQEQSPEPSSDE